jgi:acylglycerol lipase
MGASSSKPKEVIELVSFCEGDGVVFQEEMLTINGQQRNCPYWLPANHARVPVKALVFISHGLNEHALCYYPLALELLKKNFAVFAIDHVSHGKSDGRRAVVPNYNVMVTDFIEFVKLKRSAFSNIPTFIFSHSMGTLVALCAIPSIENVNAVIFSGPALFPGPSSGSPFGIKSLFWVTRTSFATCLLSCTSAMDPAGLAAPIIVNEIASDPEYMETMDKDPRRNPPIVTNKTAKEVIAMTKVAKECVPTLNIPFLCIHGEADTIALKDGSEFIFKNAGTDITQRRLNIVHGAKHEVIHEKEPVGQESLQSIVAYFEEQFAAAGDYVKRNQELVTVE